MDTKKQIADNIRAYFRSQNLTLVDVAKIFGQTKGAISNQLNSSAPFGGGVAKKWADEFGFNPSYLMFGEGELFAAVPESAAAPKASGDVVLPGAVVDLYTNMSETIRLQQETINALVQSALGAPKKSEPQSVSNNNNLGKIR